MRGPCAPSTEVAMKKTYQPKPAKLKKKTYSPGAPALKNHTYGQQSKKRS